VIKNRIISLILEVSKFNQEEAGEMIHNITYHTVKRVIVVRIVKDSKYNLVTRKMIKRPILFKEISSKKQLTTTMEYLRDLDSWIDPNSIVFLRINLNSTDKVLRFLTNAGLVDKVTHVDMAYLTYDLEAKQNNMVNKKSRKYRGYCFVTFINEISANEAINLFPQTSNSRLFFAHRNFENKAQY